MKKLTMGLAQINEDSPGWLVKVVAIVATISFAKDAVIATIPFGNADQITVWVDWILSVFNMLLAVAAAFTGRAAQQKN